MSLTLKSFILLKECPIIKVKGIVLLEERFTYYYVKLKFRPDMIIKYFLTRPKMLRQVSWPAPSCAIIFGLP